MEGRGKVSIEIGCGLGGRLGRWTITCGAFGSEACEKCLSEGKAHTIDGLRLKTNTWVF